MSKNRTAQVHALPGVGGMYGAAMDNKPNWLSTALRMGGSALMGPFGPIIGSLASAGINFGLNRIESGIQNRYNSPKRTIQRLGEAGLPTAAYLEGGGNQHATGSQQYTQPDLGVTDSISKEQTNRMQKQQFELFDLEKRLLEEKIRNEQNRADLGDASNTWNLRTDRFGMSNLERMLELKRSSVAAKAALDKTVGDIKGLDLELTRSLDNLGLRFQNYQLGMAGTQQKINESQANIVLKNTQVQKYLSDIALNWHRSLNIDSMTNLNRQTVSLRSLQERLNNDFKNSLLDGTVQQKGMQAWMANFLWNKGINLGLFGKLPK